MKHVVFICIFVLMAPLLMAHVSDYTAQLHHIRSIYDNLDTARSIPYVDQNYRPMTYAMVMNTKEFGTTHMLVEVWDGTNWYDAMQWFFYYDDGLITAYDQFFYAPTYEVAYFYHDISYDAQGRVTEMWMDLDMGTGTVAGTHEVFTYGAEGLSHWIEYADMGVGSFIQANQATYSYVDGYLAEGLYEEYDPDAMTWVNDELHTFTFENGLLDTVLMQWWDDSQWVNDYSYEYTMLDPYRADQYLVYMWSGNAFETSERFTYTYPRYQHSERLEEDWNNNMWNNDGLELVTYNNEGLPELVERFGWDDDWVLEERYLLGYDPLHMPPPVVPLSAWMQNYPNPFKPSATGRGASTEIAYSLGQDASNVEIAIYSVKGELVTTLRSEANASGAGSVLWDGRDASGAVVSSGIYLYRLKADDRPMLCKRMILMR